MFYHVFILSSLLTLAIATPNPRGGARSPDSCSTGPIRCCDAVYAASDPPAAAILQSIGVVVQDPQDTLVGLNCTSVTVVGVGPGNQWCVRSYNQSVRPV